MELFYKIVLGTAVIILILILIYVGLLMSYKKTSAGTFPAIPSICPDYWTFDGTNCILPISQTKNNGGAPQTIRSSDRVNINATIPAPQFLSTSSDYTTNSSDGTKFKPKADVWNNAGVTDICNKRAWAINNQIVWDGITNYTGC